MEDLETVLEAYEKHKRKDKHCNGCPYEDKGYRCFHLMCNDMYEHLKVLKEEIESLEDENEMLYEENERLFDECNERLFDEDLE